MHSNEIELRPINRVINFRGKISSIILCMSFSTLWMEIVWKNVWDVWHVNVLRKVYTFRRFRDNSNWCFSVCVCANCVGYWLVCLIVKSTHCSLLACRQKTTMMQATVIWLIHNKQNVSCFKAIGLKIARAHSLIKIDLLHIFKYVPTINVDVAEPVRFDIHWQ